MFVYVVRPEGFKYDVCENGTMIEDGSGLCMTYPANATVELPTSLLTDLDTALLDSDITSQTKSPLDGKDNQKRAS